MTRHRSIEILIERSTIKRVSKESIKEDADISHLVTECR